MYCLEFFPMHPQFKAHFEPMTTINLFTISQFLFILQYYKNRVIHYVSFLVGFFHLSLFILDISISLHHLTSNSYELLCNITSLSYNTIHLSSWLLENILVAFSISHLLMKLLPKFMCKFCIALGYQNDCVNT